LDSELSKMFRILTRAFAFAAGISFLFRCDNYEFPDSPYPGVETLSVANISETGVTFHATITRLSSKSITNHGFVWGFTQNLSVTSANKIQLGAATLAGGFEAEVKYGLYADSTYFVKAFLTTDLYTVYGEAVSFKSKGSIPPLISTVSPNEGTLGDTIMIIGKYFSSKVSDNEVKFGTQPSAVIGSSDSVITCVVPNGIPNSVPIFVTVAANTAKAPDDFTVVPPVIIDFSPKVGTFEDLVTILGSNFSYIKANNIVKFGEHNAEILEVSKDQLKVKVPSAIRMKENSINVTVNDQTAVAATKFTILPPSVSAVSHYAGFTGSTIEIRGDNFNPVRAGNMVLFEDRTGTIISSTRDLLTVTVPEGIYKNRTFEIEIKVAEQSAFSPQGFTLQNAWIQKADLPMGDLPPTGPRRYGAVAFSIDDKGYAGLGGDGFDNSFYRYDPVENTWTEIAPFPGGARGFAVSFVIDGMAYVGLGLDADPYVGVDSRKDLWRYDPTNNTWTRMADLPFTYDLYHCLGFSVSGKGYVVRSDVQDTFWEYNPGLNSWSQKEDMPFAFEYYADAGFVINNRLFITKTNGLPEPLPSEFWEFDFNDDSWKQKAAFMDNDYTWGPAGVGFSIGDTGYIIVGRPHNPIHKFNLPSNSWTQSTYEPIARSYPIVFVIGEKAYFGTGNSLNGEMWEFDPAYE
jgi:hypothetical protein